MVGSTSNEECPSRDRETDATLEHTAPIGPSHHSRTPHEHGVPWTGRPRRGSAAPFVGVLPSQGAILSEGRPDPPRAEVPTRTPKPARRLSRTTRSHLEGGSRSAAFSPLPPDSRWPFRSCTTAPFVLLSIFSTATAANGAWKSGTDWLNPTGATFHAA